MFWKGEPWMLKLEAASYTYNDNHKAIFTELNYEFVAGGRYILRGKNGSGKSTLIQILANRRTLTSGRLISEAKSVIYLPQQLQLADGFIYTAKEFLNNAIELIKRQQKHKSKLKLNAPNTLANLAKRYTSLVNDFKLETSLELPVSALSFGQKQKLLLVRALLGQADLYLMDEAWSSLDQATIQKLPAIFAKYIVANSCLIQISHDPENLWSDYTCLHFPLLTEVKK